MASVIVPNALYGSALAGNRVHAYEPNMWGTRPATDFWATFATNGILTAGNAHELADYGWTTTSLIFTTPSGADFITSADQGTANAITTNAAADLLQSPVIFGDYNHALQAQQFLGYLPTTLTLEAWAQFTTASANETITGFGFVEDGGSPAVANDALAMIFSDGTNFGLRSGAASDAGAAVDNSNHLWKIVVTSANVEWFIDGTSQGTIALEADEWPVSFGLTSTTTNRPALSWVHIYYS